MASQLPSITAGWTSDDWDYIAIEAQYRMSAQLLENYISGLNDVHNLSPHEPQGNIAQLTKQTAVLKQRRTMARLLLASKGRTPPDYDAYRNQWKRGDDHAK